MSKLEKQKNPTKGYERPSDRMFRRSRRARANRKESERKEARFVRFIFSVASIATLIVFVIIYLFSGQFAHAAPVRPEVDLTAPILGKFSIIDLGGFVFVAVAGYAVYQRYKFKD